MARAVAASSSAVRGRSVARSRFRNRIVILALAAGALVVGVPLFFAGSADRLADGTRIAGIDVGGLSPKAAQTLLERRSARLAEVPVTFVAGDRTFKITPKLDGGRGRLALRPSRPPRARAAASASCAATGGSSSSSSRRISIRRFAPTAPPSTTSSVCSARPSTPRIGRPRSSVTACTSRSHPARPAESSIGRPLAPGSSTSLASFSRAPVALPVRVDPPRRDRRVADARPAARVADHLGPGDADRRADPPARAALAAREAARPRHDAPRGAGGRRLSSRVSSAGSTSPRRMRRSRSRGAARSASSRRSRASPWTSLAP